MGLMLLLSILIGILIGSAIVALGVFIVRYKLAIQLFKRPMETGAQELNDEDDFEVKEGREGFFPNALAVIGDSFSLLVGSKEEDAVCDPRDKKTNGTIVYFGQAIIIIGYLVALYPLISGLFLMSIRSGPSFRF